MIFLALVPFLWAIQGVSPGKAFRLGLFAGFIHYVSLLYWIVIVLGFYGHLAWWVSVPALILLSLYMSLYTAFFAMGAAVMQQRLFAFIWLAPTAWVALDFIRGTVFSGFPWQDVGYSLYRIPLLIQVADLVGHHGITYLIILINCLFFAVIKIVSRLSDDNVNHGQTRDAQWKTSLSLGIGLLFVLITAYYNFSRYQEVEYLVNQSQSIPVVVVQGNIPQDQKWTPEMQEETLKIYTDLSISALSTMTKENASPILIWPETAIPLYLHEDGRIPIIIESMTQDEGVFLLTGAPYIEESSASGSSEAQRHYNSAVLISDNGKIIDRYDKQHLVPFGEYIPFRSILPSVAPVVESMGDFNAGSKRGPLSCQNVKLGILICFESIFPDLSRNWAAEGANLLVNITNDAWFGRSSAPWQHLSMAVFRAVETRKSMARAANTGVSGFVDPLGRLLSVSSLFESDYLMAKIPLLGSSTTFVRYGHYFPSMCLIVTLLTIVSGIRRKRGM